jgi:hypothetical protein
MGYTKFNKQEDRLSTNDLGFYYWLAHRVKKDWLDSDTGTLYNFAFISDDNSIVLSTMQPFWSFDISNWAFPLGAPKLKTIDNASLLTDFYSHDKQELLFNWKNVMVSRRYEVEKPTSEVATLQNEMV